MVVHPLSNDLPALDIFLSSVFCNAWSDSNKCSIEEIVNLLEILNMPLFFFELLVITMETKQSTAYLKDKVHEDKRKVIGQVWDKRHNDPPANQVFSCLVGQSTLDADLCVDDT